MILNKISGPKSTTDVSQSDWLALSGTGAWHAVAPNGGSVYLPKYHSTGIYDTESVNGQ